MEGDTASLLSLARLGWISSLPLLCVFSMAMLLTVRAPGQHMQPPLLQTWTWMEWPPCLTLSHAYRPLASSARMEFLLALRAPLRPTSLLAVQLSGQIVQPPLLQSWAGMEWPPCLDVLQGTRLLGQDGFPPRLACVSSTYFAACCPTLWPARAAASASVLGSDGMASLSGRVARESAPSPLPQPATRASAWTDVLQCQRRCPTSSLSSSAAGGTSRADSDRLALAPTVRTSLRPRPQLNR